MDKLYAMAFITSTVLMMACSAPVYQSSTEQNTAQISFISLNDNFPELELRLRGKRHPIDLNNIRLAGDDSSEKKVIHVPAGETVHLRYEALVIRDTSLQPFMKHYVSYSADNILTTGKLDIVADHVTDFTTERTIQSCESEFSFITEKNKKYEAYLQQAAGKICKLNIVTATHL